MDKRVQLLSALGDLTKNISSEEIGWLTDCSEYIEILRGQILIAEREKCDSFYLVVHGSFRYYYQFDIEKEITSDFAFTGDVVGSLNAIVNQTPSYCSIAALTHSEVLKINYEKLGKLYKKSPALEHVGRVLLERAFVQLEKKYRRLLITDAKDRYTDILANHPQILNEVPLKYLASYLNINQQHLSRIRREIFR